MSHSHDDDAADILVPKSPKSATSSNFGSPNGSGPDLDGMCGRSDLAMEEQFKELRDVLGPLMRSVTNFESRVQTISNSVGLLTSRINNVEQIVSALSAKMVAFTEMEQRPHCTHAQDRNRCDLSLKCLRITQDPGQIDGSPPPGPVTRALRKETGIQDAGSTLTRVQITRMHEAPSSYGFFANNATKACPHGSTRAKSSLQNRIVLKSQMSRLRGKVQIGWPPYTVNSPFFECHEYNSCASVQVARMARDRSTFCTAVGSVGCKATRKFPW